MQSDPIGLGGGLNTYGYVNGSPLQYVDMYGLRRSGVSGVFKKFYEEAVKNGVQSGIEADMRDRKQQRTNDIKKQIEKINEAIEANDMRRLACDYNCMTQRDSEPCFNFQECMDACWSNYSEHFDLLMTDRFKWQDLLKKELLLPF